MKSKLWATLTGREFAVIDDPFLAHFREPAQANNRLACWSPLERSTRYYKFLLYQQLHTKPPSFVESYRRLGNTMIGNPVTVNGINLDHFLAVEEYEFIRDVLSALSYLAEEQYRRVLEIGAGFGRTAQAFLKLHSTLRYYIILDLPEMLVLSRRYLHAVLTDEEYGKVEFVAVTDRVPSFDVDLVLNIDSFQEMRPETIREYYRQVIEPSRYFYSKNPVGKYRPESVGVDGVDCQDVFDLGLSRDVLDIFNDQELEKARVKHVRAYQPKGFVPIATAPLGIFPYYQHVLYEKD